MKNKRPRHRLPATTSARAAQSARKTSAEFQRRKLRWALVIMTVGMVIALAWNAHEGWGRGRGYPYNTMLFSPDCRFNDLTDMTLAASRANPYEEPFTAYFPFAMLFFRGLNALPYDFGITAFLFVSMGAMFVLLFLVLDSITASPWKRTGLSLLCLAVAYPVVAAFDRANLDMLVAPVVAIALLLFSRGRYALGTLCLVPVISFKLYPVLFFLLLLRQRRVALIAGGSIACIVLTFLSLAALSLSLQTALEFYQRNLVLINRFYIYENYELEGASSLWNACKLCLITAAQFQLISPVDYSFDGTFIRFLYSLYSAGSALTIAVLAVYVCLVEKEFTRCVMVLLLYVSTAAPLGGDYRLLYVAIALVVLVLDKTRRPHDLLIVVLLALVMAPKKEFLLTYAGHTETGFRDVTIQCLLNPFLIVGALLLILYDSRAAFDPRWARLRLRRLVGAFIPSTTGFVRPA